MFAFGTKFKIITANEGLLYIAVYIGFIHKHQFSSYSLSKNEFLSILLALKKRILIN
jgi:hypothetical protein